VACFPSRISIQEGGQENILIWHVVTDAITVNMIIGVWREIIAKRLSSICRSKAQAILRTSERKTFSLPKY
jgi:hypothetical protein